MGAHFAGAVSGKVRGFTDPVEPGSTNETPNRLGLFEAPPPTLINGSNFRNPQRLRIVGLGPIMPGEGVRLQDRNR
jgi:hypothetical protein